jgi:ribose 5-phosphate isomerase RpiB
MKIALIMDTSQASKSELVYNTLTKVANDYDHIVVHYGMYSENDSHSLTYVKAGLLAGILLNSGAVDFVITGCGTGEGAMLSCNAFPNVVCGHITDPADAYMFRKINNGNAVALPFAKGFGWGAELNLEYVLDKLLSTTGGDGYPADRAVPERENREILADISKTTHKDMLTILKEIDRKFLKETIDYRFFKVNFFADCKDEKMAEFLRSVLED